MLCTSFISGRVLTEERIFHEILKILFERRFLEVECTTNQINRLFFFNDLKLSWIKFWIFFLRVFKNLKIGGRIRKKKRKKNEKNRREGMTDISKFIESLVLQFSGLEFFCCAMEFRFGMHVCRNKLYLFFTIPVVGLTTAFFQKINTKIYHHFEISLTINHHGKRPLLGSNKIADFCSYWTKSHRADFLWKRGADILHTWLIFISYFRMILINLDFWLYEM